MATPIPGKLRAKVWGRSVGVDGRKLAGRIPVALGSGVKLQVGAGRVPALTKNTLQPASNNTDNFDQNLLSAHLRPVIAPSTIHKYVINPCYGVNVPPQNKFHVGNSSQCNNVERWGPLRHDGPQGPCLMNGCMLSPQAGFIILGVGSFSQE